MTGGIVCGIDDSAQARSAARVAGGLAEGLGIPLTLVNASTPIPFVPPPGRVPRVPDSAVEAVHREREERAMAMLDAVARDAGVEGAGRRTAPGDAAEFLIEAARDEGASLIVVGSRGQGAVRSALLGSVSASVVRDAPCPVVVVPADAADAP